MPALPHGKSCTFVACFVPRPCDQKTILTIDDATELEAYAADSLPHEAMQPCLEFVP
jgi:hypothetical protein